MGNAAIHPSSIVEDGAVLGAGVEIGPFCHVGPQARLGDHVRLVSHVSILGATSVGEGTVIHPHAALGSPPQNTKHTGGRTTLTIGRNCTIRENVTMHCGTDTSRGETVVGDNGNFLVGSHVAHDCIVGDNVTFANLASIAGHCEIGDSVILGGLSAVHQFARIGHHAFIGGLTGIAGDVMPYGMAVGDRASLRGLNVIGMRRAGLPRSEIMTLRQAYKVIFDRARPLEENVRIASERFAGSAVVADVIDFLTSRGKRPYTVPALDDPGADDADES
ncbi:MAG: acyl-ACP--UDP-N-acetylglucosamine O-acyltransferase [Rhizobiaceae bacterium]|nr:acyl-ACP--UDP-N-acetylglucosamine O-acyltransferase [Rhizobiaceae bacterium]MCV0407195.1 acyl-ACP--UDP-N-acetylglucosamine O-acyltransferase [Rhizobiaceae bacterium]